MNAYCYFPSPNADYTGSSAPPPYSAYSAQPYVTLPPMKATVDLPPFQVPVAPYYWDPNKPCAEPIPPSPTSDETDDFDDPESSYPYPYPYPYQYQYQYQYQYADPAENPEKCKGKSAECKCGCDKHKPAAPSSTPYPYPYPYPYPLPADNPEKPAAPSSYPYPYPYPYPLPAENPDKGKSDPVTLSRKGFATRKRKSLRSYGADLPFDSLNLAPRPAYWRLDYAPPHSAHSKSAKLRRFTLRGRSAGQHMFTAGSRSNYTLHSLINYASSSTHPLAYDIRQDPQKIYIQYLNLPRHSNDVDWYQVATTPPMHELHLYHQKLPWTITIRATQTNGITIGDIFDQIYEDLSSRVTRQEFYNVTLNPSDREEMTTAFYYRGGSETGDGLLRMDFLGFDVVFQGLTKGKNGLVEIKTGPATAP